MKKSQLHLIGLLIASSIFTQCKKSTPNNPDPNPQMDTITKYDPVETNNPNTNYTPAFEGQTRTFGIKTYTPLKIEIINNNLSSPWGIEVLPDNDMIVTQKGGNIQVLGPQGNIKASINNLPPVVASGQGGLLDIAISQNFAQDRTIFWTYASQQSNGTATAVAKGTLTDTYILENIETIYTALPAYNGFNHYGGRLTFDNLGNLLVTTGDRSDAQIRGHAQLKDNGLGKILRIKTDGQPANNNPFEQDVGSLPELYSYGHRNVQGIAIDRFNNIIYESELGPRGGDEINIIQPGRNYGWPIITYGLEYSGSPIGSGATQQNGMEQPMYYWDPVISPSGMIFYHHNLIPEWENNLLIAGLNGSHIARLRIKNGKIAGEERLLANEGQRFRDLATNEQGVVFAITDSGRLYAISAQ